MEESRLPMLPDVSLQEIVTDAEQERPFVFMPFRSNRLYLDVEDPETWCVATHGRYLRDLFRDPLRNPHGIPVETSAKWITTRAFPTPNVLVLGHMLIGNRRAKFARMVRRHAGGVDRGAICVDSSFPEGIKRFNVLWALGVSHLVFGHVREFHNRHVEFRSFGKAEVPVGLYPHSVGPVRAGFQASADMRFAGRSTSDLAENPKP